MLRARPETRLIAATCLVVTACAIAEAAPVVNMTQKTDKQPADYLVWEYETDIVGPLADKVTGTVTFNTSVAIVGGVSSPSTANGGVVDWTFEIIPGGGGDESSFSLATHPVPYTFTDLPILADGLPGDTAFGVFIEIPRATPGAAANRLWITDTDFNGSFGTALSGEFSSSIGFNGTYSFSEFQAVPEPSSLAFLGIVGIGILGFSRRRGNKEKT